MSIKKLKMLFCSFLLFILWAVSGYLIVYPSDVPHALWYHYILPFGIWFSVGSLLSQLYIPAQRKWVRTITSVIGLAFLIRFWILSLQICIPSFNDHFSFFNQDRATGLFFWRSLDCPYVYALPGAFIGISISHGPTTKNDTFQYV